MKRVTLRRLAWLGTTLLALTAAPDVSSQLRHPKVVHGDGEHVGGYFSAGPQGAVFAFPGKARLELEPGTELRVFSKSQRLRMPEGYAVDTWSVVVKKGRVRAEVPNPKKVAILLTVSTEFSSVIAQGTGIAIIDSSEYSAVNVDGVSHTITGGRWESLPAGSVRSYRPSTKLVETTQTLGPTNLLPGRRLWVSTRRSVTLDGFKWQPLNGARRYAIALSRFGEDEPIAEQESTTALLPQAFGPVGPGRYQLRVRGVDRRGLPGRWSEPADLRVIGVDLPEGAYVSPSGDINLGEGQRARFTNAEGLELTYSGAHRYVPGTTLVPLHQGQRTLVSLRHPVSQEIAVAKLVPRKIEADIQIGPKTARWPEDTVQIAIRLRSDGSDPPPLTIKPRARVTLGVKPIELDWRWEGSTLRATVPPQHGKGPWVVRVEVEDQYGLPLGRDLLEVVPAGS